MVVADGLGWRFLFYVSVLKEMGASPFRMANFSSRLVTAWRIALVFRKGWFVEGRC
jgi:hypothetical protein